MRRIESFDIFDTVLTRRLGDPRAAFLRLGHRLASKQLISCSAESFARQRTAAEVRAFRNAGGLDSSVNLDTIYGEMRVSLGIDHTTQGKLIAEELDLESDLLVPMSDGARRVAAARSRGHEVIFVSDMYLPSWFIREQLTRHKLIEDGERLFVSNDYSASKATGALWPHVLRELDVDAKHIHHTGDRKRSDYLSPDAPGCAQDVEAGNLNRFERQLENWAHETDGLTSMLAGASRRVRTELPVRTEHEGHIRDVAAGVVTPFLVGNVLWILRQAMESQVEKVFFIARDGQIMLDVAQALAPKVGYTGELSYLLGSRSAWLLPSLCSIDDDKISSAVPADGDVDDVTLELIADRFGVEPEQLEPQLSDAGLVPNMWRRPLSTKDRRTLRNLLRRDDVSSTILGLAAEQRALMLRYLDQEGVITNAPIAIVDQGTGSTLFNALSSVLETVGQRPPLAFYFGLRPDAADLGFGVPETYIRNEQSGSGFLKTPGLLTLVEMACTADHGSVIGYSDLDGHVGADLADPGNDAVVEWGFEILRSTIRATVQELATSPLPLPCGIDLRPATIDVFELFWTNPTRAEATAWGNYPFEDGWSGDTVSLTLAHRQGMRDALRSQPHRHWWNGGAEALSSPIPRTMLRGRAELVSFVRKVNHRIG